MTSKIRVNLVGSEIDRRRRRRQAAAERAARPPEPEGPVLVRRYDSEADFQRDATERIAGGWRIAGQSTRTRKWSWWTGIYTNKGITTVTWVRSEQGES